MVVHSHTCKSGHRFALTARGDKDYPLVLIAVHHFDIDDDSVRYVKVAEFHSSIDYVYHASAEYSNFSAVSYSAVDYLLNTVYIG